MAKAPDWIQQARSKWKFTGQKRPDFANEPEHDQVDRMIADLSNGRGVRQR